jgi:K+-sensing histidine kinase KdpD
MAEKVQALFRDNDQAILESADFGPSLVILKGVVDLHGGQVSLQNDPLAGCTFTIRLPIYQAETSSVVAA